MNLLTKVALATTGVLVAACLVKRNLELEVQVSKCAKKSPVKKTLVEIPNVQLTLVRKADVDADQRSAKVQMTLDLIYDPNTNHVSLALDSKEDIVEAIANSPDSSKPINVDRAFRSIQRAILKLNDLIKEQSADELLYPELLEDFKVTGTKLDHIAIFSKTDEE